MITKTQASAILNSRKSTLAISAIAGLSYGTYAGITATTVVAGATAVPGAIKTASVVVGGKTMILSTITASLATKIITGIAGTILIGGIVYYTLSSFSKKQQ